MSTRIISKKEMARLRGVSERTLEREQAEGTGVPYVRISARRIGYCEEDYEAWLADRRFAHRAQELATASRTSDKG